MRTADHGTEHERREADIDPGAERPSVDRPIDPPGHVRVILVPAAIFLVLCMSLLVSAGAFARGPGNRAFGEDANVYVAATTILRHGGNPYDNRLLFATEHAILRQQGLKIYESRSLVRVGSPPLFFWLIGPLATLPFRLAVLLWVVAMYALSAVGFLFALRSAEWKNWVIPLLFFLALPQVDQGSLYGEITAIYFAAIAIALLLARRCPFIAGCVLSLAWIKPPIALPLALLAMGFYAANWRRAASGFLASTAALFALTLITTGWNGLSQWIAGLGSFSQDMASQPGLVSLTGFYVRWAPSSLRVVLESVTVLVALAVTFLVWKRSAKPLGLSDLSVAWLWVLWMLATPYAHYPDEILLVIPAFALFGRNGVHITRRTSVIALYLTVFSLWFALGKGLRFQLTPLVPLITGVCLILAARDHGSEPNIEKQPDFREHGKLPGTDVPPSMYQNGAVQRLPFG